MQFADTTLRQNLRVLIYRPDDLPSVWLAHVLDFDLVTEGTDPEDAMNMACGAVTTYCDYRMGQGLDPFETHLAPAEDIQQHERIESFGAPLDEFELRNVNADVRIAGRIDAFIPCVDVESEIPRPMSVLSAQHQAQELQRLYAEYYAA